jgi:GH25 family lysozyme M1 (1,4-beta-N-acetylmuramidase)
MGLKYSSFAIKGIDVSLFNGTIDWTKVDAHFSGIRVGYGRTIDSKFVENWLKSKSRVNRIPYWYMDYYSNHIKGFGADGVSDAEWGKIQAEICWNALKGDFEGILFLDIENGNPAYAKPLTDSATKKSAQITARAFLERFDQLSGKFNGIYTSVGWLSWFSAWFKDRPLWCAWYNESQTAESVKKAVKTAGWTGTCLIWQYASHGCTNGDGIPQGKNFGMEMKVLDLNAWIGPVSFYSALFGGLLVVVTPEDETPIEEPVDEPIDITGEFVEYVINTSELNVRALPTTNSKIVGRYVSGWPVNVEKSVDIGTGSVAGWKRLYGQQGYMALDYLKLKT